VQGQPLNFLNGIRNSDYHKTNCNYCIF